MFVGVSFPAFPATFFFFLCMWSLIIYSHHADDCFVLQFFEELVHGKDSGVKLSMLPNKPMNKKIKFSYSDSGSDDDDDDIDDEEDKSDLHREKDANDENPSNEKSHPQKNDDVCRENQNKEKADDKTQDGNENQENDADGEKADKNTEDGNENQEVDAEEPSAKKQCLETDASTHIIHEKTEEKSIDKLIEAELQELGDRNKVKLAEPLKFASLFCSFLIYMFRLA